MGIYSLTPHDFTVGYTYEAETLCPSCTYKAVLADFDPYRGPEHELDMLASKMGIDREDEYTFDSDDFPKVITAGMIDSNEKCDDCGEALLS